MTARQQCLCRALTSLVVWACLAGAGPFGAARRACGAPESPGTDRPSVEAVRQLLNEGRYPEAERAARALLAAIETAAGPNALDTAEALDLVVEAMVENRRVAGDEALELARRAVGIGERVFGPEDVKLSQSVTLRGLVLLHRGDHEESLLDLERALAIRGKALGDASGETAAAHLNLGVLLREMGDLGGAESHLRRALSIYEGADGTESDDAAEVLRALGRVADDRGLRAEAEALYGRSLELFEGTLGSRHVKSAMALFGLGTARADPELARQTIAQALAILVEALGPESPRIILVLANLGGADGYCGMGVQNLEKAVALAEKAWGPEYYMTAVCKGNLGAVLSMTDPVRARELIEQAHRVLLSKFGPNHRWTNWTFANLGGVAHKLGDYDTARRCLEQALAGQERTPDPEPFQVTNTLRSLGQVYFETGRTAEARAAYERAIAITERVFGRDYPGLALTLGSYAILLESEGDLTGARAALQRALRVRERKTTIDSPDLVVNVLALAELEADAGRPDEARRLFSRALDLQRDLPAPDGLYSSCGEQRFASFLLRTGDRSGSLEAATRAEALRRRFLGLTLASVPERHALSLAASTASGLALTISAALGGQRSDAQVALDAVVRSRALVLDEMGKRHRAARQGWAPEVRRLVDAHVAASARLANLTVQGAAESPPEKYGVRLQNARHEKEAVERALAAASASFRRSEARSRAGLEEVAAALPRRTALVSYVRYPRHEVGPLKAPALPPVDSYAAFVLREGRSAPELIDLGSAGSVDREVAAVRGRLVEAERATGSLQVAAEASYRRVGEVLRQRVWDPLEPLLTDVETVFLVPDGALNLVSFAALPVGGTDYLLEWGPRLHYLGAERDLVALDEGGGSGLLAVGDPAFDEGSLFAALRGPELAPSQEEQVVASARPFRGQPASCGDFKSLRFAPLPSSAPEVAEVASAWGAVGAGEARVLRGPAAAELAVKLAAPGRSVLHLATHGFFLGEGCPSVLDGRRTPSGESSPLAFLGENPLLLSGLALAGANHRQAAGADEDDGILTAEEIAALDLDGVDWAVLSACDTGLGAIRAGEGVFGLRRAFQVAGVHTVIVSLWPVEDEAGRRWMRALYANRFDKAMSTVDAVNAASLEELQRRRRAGLNTHPFYWGGFVAAGDWR